MFLKKQESYDNVNKNPVDWQKFDINGQSLGKVLTGTRRDCIKSSKIGFGQSLNEKFMLRANSVVNSSKFDSSIYSEFPSNLYNLSSNSSDFRY